jgi:hypothetical protein
VGFALGEGTQTGGRGICFVRQVQLSIAEEGCSRKRGRRPQHSCFYKLVAAARKEQFGAKPGSAIAFKATLEGEFLVPH